MFLFKKWKIQAYLNNLDDNKAAFDLLLCVDCFGETVHVFYNRIVRNRYHKNLR